MKALVYESFQAPLRIQQVPDPTPSSDGVVIKVAATGLCRSDWHGWMGHDPDIQLPHIPGHELAGTIEAMGKNVRGFSVGDRVTMPFVCGCGSCSQCISGNHQVCDTQSQPGFTHWGSFAEYTTIDYASTNLVKLPEEISNETAATLGCRFITSFRAVVDQGKVQGGQYVAIHGCGGVGLSAIMIARALGAQVIAIDISEASLAFAKAVGATYTINAHQSPDVVSHIKDLSQGGAHVSIDALGSAVTCFNSISCLRKRGKHIQVGLMTGDHKHQKVPMDRILSDELEIIGSHGMQAHRYPEMLAMIKNGQLHPEMLIEKTISLEDAITELPAMDQFKNKGVLVIDTF
ncbi:alcohol dehydrogenase [Dokdonia pacifica]|uniref:Alcohol dehydrogenase n=1 Tax=Dokdonia pacifica TaxID=1627892 RepID=A0A238YQM6_9FLAO|nr:zinc-dependent alcohol dehydrogenase family protein [Dokdonia pacifica]GGG10861.1 alcohol dehydrogenase [Dokdonia pacifica]SNR73098.1 alcohol dehydrogenase [Dokdonia pacifica]